MKIIYALVYLVVFSTLPHAQFKTAFDKKILIDQNALLSQLILKSEDYSYSDSSSNPANPDSLSELKKEILDTNKLKNNINDAKINRNVVVPIFNSKKIFVKNQI